MRGKMAEIKMVRKNINFPEELLEEASDICRELKMSFSKFIRKAAAEFILNAEKARLENELREGYKAKAELNKRTAEDFKYIDGENI
jgi:metal-responsive CopG/Arc/MetJ family transcriptional regulator